jgi:hypothetical protein
LAWQSQNFLSKFSGEGTASAVERRDAAIAKWLLMERRNRRTNERLILSNPDFGSVRGSDILSFARMVVRQIIGRSPPSDILFGGFTNGASTRIKRGPTAIAQKYVGEAHVTQSALPHLRKVMEESAPWVTEYFNQEFVPIVVPGSVLFTVPKNSEIDRVACKEPELNMYMQRGVGNYFRSQLRKRGINLNDQSVNRRLAREGSISGKLATLDLSSASDLISTKLVSILLPREWFSLLDDLRVKSTQIDGKDHELSMFSSMGNGFTFELESLLFYAISCAINRCWSIRGRISVYGDDIITPTRIAPMYTRVFAWLGFIVNTKKSCFRGHFRESCGGHYYYGSDVTPFFLRAPLVFMDDLIHQLNQLRKWATHEDAFVDFFFPGVYSFWLKYAAKVPWYLRGGKDVEDKSALVTVDPPRKRLTISTREVRCDQRGAYLHWLHTASNRSDAFDGRYGCPHWLNQKFAIRDRDRVDELATSTALATGQRKLARNRTWERNLTAYWLSEILGE